MALVKRMAYNGIRPHLCASTVNIKVLVIGNPPEASNPRVLRAGSDLVHRMKLLDDGTKLIIETEL
jgi:hypothetical protein